MMMEPMPANERRIIHMALADNRNVSTSSSGEGEDRAVTISPRGDSRR
jgi:spoIIIJ-associated protein